MLIPQLYYAESSDKTKVACSVSMVPTFDAVAPQDAELSVVKDEEPELQELGGSDGSAYHFIFLVDRSASMQACNRM